MSKSKNIDTNTKLTREDMLTADVAGEKLQQLRELFPGAFGEGVDEDGNTVPRVDCERILAEIGLGTDAFFTRRERYGLDWPGKTECVKLIQQPSLATLKPCPEESVDFDTTENLFIEGDNLEVLKLLQKSYFGKVKMIYIDPPYNTGKDFVYPDNFAEPLENYLELTGQTDVLGRKLSANAETAGRFHSNWLNMMFPRLYLARNLLREDGMIVIHIDEHELCNLDKLLIEIFGEENNLGSIIWDKRNPKGDAQGIASQHETIVLYAKNIDRFCEKCELVRPKQNADAILLKAAELVQKDGVTESTRKEFKKWLRQQNSFSGGEKAYSSLDDNGEVYRLVSMAWPNKKKAPDDYFIPLIHPKTGKPCPVPKRGWRNPPSTMDALIKKADY